MLEQRRADYLKAMGVTLWLPRTPLPNAQPPRWIPEKADLKAEQGEQAPVSPRRPAAATELLNPPSNARSDQRPAVAPRGNASAETQDLSSAPRIADAVSEVLKPVVPAAETPATPGSAVTVPAAPATAENEHAQAGSETVPRFELHFLRVSERGIWVCDAATDVEALKHFIRRVMGAFYVPVVFMERTPSFRWPFLSARNDDQSEPVALQALTTQWQVLQQEGAGYVVCVGKDAGHWLGRIGVSPVCQLGDLESLQTEAGDKRQLWLALQSLQDF